MGLWDIFFAVDLVFSTRHLLKKELARGIRGRRVLHPEHRDAEHSPILNHIPLRLALVVVLQFLQAGIHWTFLDQHLRLLSGGSFVAILMPDKS